MKLAFFIIIFIAELSSLISVTLGKVVDSCNLKPELLKEIKSYQPIVDMVKNFPAETIWKLPNEETDMRKFNIENVHEEDSFPMYYENLKTKAVMVEPRRQKVRLRFFNSSPSLNNKTADVMVFDSIDEFKKRKDEIKGKVVIFNLNNNNPYPKLEEAGLEFFEATKYKPLAVLSKSSEIPEPDEITSVFRESRYDIDYEFRCGYISSEDAINFSKMQKQGMKMKIQFRENSDTDTSDTMLPRECMVGEMAGKETPEKVVLLINNVEALLLLKILGLRPKKTLRVALYNYIVSPEEIKNVEISMIYYAGTRFAFMGSEEAACVLREVFKFFNYTFTMKKQMIISEVGYNYIPTIKLDRSHESEPYPEDAVQYEHLKNWAAIAYIIANLSEPIPRNFLSI